MSRAFHKVINDLYNNKIEQNKKYSNISIPCSLGFNVINIIKHDDNKGIYIVSNGKEQRVAKTVPLYTIGNEIYLMEKMSNLGISPLIYKTDVFEHKGEEMAYFEMEMMTGTLEDVLKVKLEDKDLDIILRLVLLLLRAMYNNKISHGDYHWKNIGVKYDGCRRKIDVMILDFEFGEFNRNERLDMLQLIRSLDKRYSDMNENNAMYLRDKLIQIYNKYFVDNIQYKDIEKEFEKYKSV
jgi:tRNA A-37 threonylcarbamoyl transferase component Bud32